MHYLATIVGNGQTAAPGTPEFTEGVAKYAAFQEAAGAAIAGGAALFPSATAINVRRSGDQTLVSDGPYTEQAEVVTGFYVFDAQDLDEAIQLARGIPAAARGAIEVRPLAMWGPHGVPAADWWLALLWERQSDVLVPGTPDWEKMALEHGQFAEKVGDAIRGGGALQPPDTATTVRVRDGQLLLTDGPFTEGAEVVDGLYVFTAASPAEATEIAAQIPRGPQGRSELRRIVDVGF
ncbi:transcription initiation protein [Nocardia colli]|uniref:Transcription initiation protein n=1 Tax=Nocardia colli TaxID=2545717 RepID=A0A5N0DTB3_9NOCA|nr:YciI family protein [Nocardia colli]KAA8880023.1 transcription initiation protein [Nocardia colli]